jgi:CRP/FNR family transcriptional regulator, cyclic AMP receptor protein
MPTNPEFLQEFSCFRNLPEDKLKKIAEISNAVCYLPGHTLFNEGEEGKYLYFLVKGKVEVFYHIGEEDQVRVDMISGEEIAGCSILIEPYIYTATERCLTEIEVLEIDAHEFRELMRKDCQFGMMVQEYIIKVLNRRILDLRLGFMSS